MDERRSYWAWAASIALHGAVLVLILLGFASAPQFEDNPEAIPVDTVSLSELNQIMNGEKDARPAPEPPPRAEPAPTPKPPEPPPDLRAAVGPAPEPPPRPESAPPPKGPPSRRRSPAAFAAEVGRERAGAAGAPERARAGKAEAGKAEAGPDRQGARTREERSPAEACPSLRSKRDRQADRRPKPSTTSTAAHEGKATPLGLPHHDAPRMSLSLASALDAWLTESYLNCWSPPPVMPEGDVYVAEIKVVFNPDGSLSTRPVLLNPPTDPAWRAHAESAMRAVKKCDPLHVPPQYAPYFEEWKVETIHFDPRETQG